MKEVLHFLGLNAKGEGIVRIGQCSNKHLHLNHFTCRWLNVTLGITGKIHEQFLPGFISVRQDTNGSLFNNKILFQMKEELALPIPVRMLPDVLFPQEKPCYVRYLQLINEVW